MKGWQMTGTGKRAGTNILCVHCVPSYSAFLFSCFIALVSCHYSRPNLEDEHLSKETRDSLAYLLSGIILGIPIWKCWQIL